MRRCLAIAVVLLLLPAATVGAETTYIVKGAGFGHGVGLSQYGAYGYAKQGWGYRRIVLHYYRGTRLEEARDRRVGVLLQASRSPGASFSGATRIGDADLRSGRIYEVRPSGSGVSVRSEGGRLVGEFSRPVYASRSGGGPIRLLGTAINGHADGLYRGRLEFRPGTSGGVTVVNAVGIEDYLRGVVPNEVPSSWPADALKAQAVVARGYAVAGRARGSVFDFYPDQRSQVYEGKDGERSSTDAAIRATSERVLRYRGEVATTYFFSTSGGRTENAENSFYGPSVPYLRSVPDPYDDASSLHRWRLEFPKEEMKSRLSGLFSGRFRGIRVLERGESPRIVRAKVRGSDSSSTVTGRALVARLDLYDAWAHFTETDSSSKTSSARTANTTEEPRTFSITPPLESIPTAP